MELLRDKKIKYEKNVEKIRLNPCCNGITERLKLNFLLLTKKCLNPCCNGITERLEKVQC